jgi:hypothetical protein
VLVGVGRRNHHGHFWQALDDIHGWVFYGGWGFDYGYFYSMACRYSRMIISPGWMDDYFPWMDF